MKDMAHGTEEIKNLCTPRPDKPEYPYGLKIHLGPNEIKKLNFMDQPKVGNEFTLIAKVEVCSVSKEEDQEKEGFNLSLQIKEMDIKSQKEEENKEEQILYGE